MNDVPHIGISIEVPIINEETGAQLGCWLKMTTPARFEVGEGDEEDERHPMVRATDNFATVVIESAHTLRAKILASGLLPEHPTDQEEAAEYRPWENEPDF